VLSLAPGGTERLVVELVRRLSKIAPQAVCCLDAAGAWGEALRADGTEVHVLDRQPGFHPSLGARLSRVATVTGASVLHCHQYSPFVYGALARILRPGLRIIFTEHGRLTDAPPSAKRRLVNPWLARSAERIASVSSHLSQHMVAEGFPKARIEVVHNGIDIGPLPTSSDRAAARARLGVTPATFVIGTVARLDPVKDLTSLIDALGHPLLAQRLVRLVIVGDGPERDRLERQAAERDLGSRVQFLGHRDDARDWLAGFDAYANSSVSEGISLTILEAMAAGLPVVATAVGGTPEIVSAECGMLEPAREPDRLAAALVTLADDRGQRAALGAAARARVERDFTIERMVGRYLDMYRGSD
jgi:glycosyltransferase involved in cell wall biosynthesis